MNSNSLYRNGSFNLQFIFGLIAVAMVGVSIYLTKHYFDVVYPSGLGGASTLCDISSFFNCDSATLSPLSNFMGIPISVGGMLVGLFLLAGFFIKSDAVEKTNHFLLWVNIVGCLVLFIYSLVSLGSLCPMCTLYYILSGIALFLLSRSAGKPALDVKVAGGYVITALIFGGVFFTISKGEADKIGRMAPALIQSYKALPDLGKPETDSPFRLASATEKFEDAPIQITMFSDFQCPACRMLSEVMHTVLKNYKGQVNAQYFFYPLDPNCNEAMKSPLHPYACQAAYVATCLKDNFATVHDTIFENQGNLSTEWLQNFAKKENALDCMNAPETKEQVVSLIKQAAPFNVRSTPTLIINGKKIEGVLPLNQMKVILDEILRNGKK